MDKYNYISVFGITVADKEENKMIKVNQNNTFISESSWQNFKRKIQKIDDYISFKQLENLKKELAVAKHTSSK